MPLDALLAQYVTDNSRQTGEEEDCEGMLERERERECVCVRVYMFVGKRERYIQRERLFTMSGRGHHRKQLRCEQADNVS